MPKLRQMLSARTPKLVRVVHILEWVCIKDFVSSMWGGCVRPEQDRGMLARAAGLIERLAMARALKRIYDFSMWKKYRADQLLTLTNRWNPSRHSHCL